MRRIAIISILFICIIICGACQDESLLESRQEVAQDTELALPCALSEKDYSALSTKKIGWGFKRNKNAPPDITSQEKELLSKYGAVYIDKEGTNSVYLTFDEGYENGYTGKILDVLRANDVPAAFFITAPYLKTNPELVDRMVNEGHIVGNHSVNHPSLPDVTNLKTFEDELLGLDQMFYDRYRINMKYLRPPRGEYSERSLAISKDLGYINVFWSFAYVDWDTKKQRGADYAFSQITDGVHDGCVMLLHAVSKDNAQVLDSVIKEIKKRGYQFKSLDDMSILKGE